MLELIISSSVLILAVVLLRRVLRGKISLRLQYALWAVVALRLLVPVSFGNSPVSVLNAVPEHPRSLYVQYTGDIGSVTPAQPAANTAPAVTAPQNPRPSASPGITLIDHLPDEAELPANTTVGSLSYLLFPAWCAGAGAMLVWFLWVNLEFRRNLRASARRVEISGCPLPVFVADNIPSPCLFGLFRPAVYLTPLCLEDKSRTGHVLTHELTHWRHKDPLWSLVRCLCLSIWWFHPLVWLAASLSRRDCELACDEGALARLGERERTAYGRTLIGLMTVSSSPTHLLQTATTMVDRKRGLKERLTLIARKPKMAATAAVAAVLIAAVAAACTFTGAELNPTDTPEPDPAPVLSAETFTPLTQGELDWFNEGFFNQQPDEARNMHNMFLVPLYSNAKQIDLFTLLYNGIGFVSVGDNELAQLAALDEMAADLDVVRIPAADLEDCLRTNLGFGLEETSRTGLDEFYYLSGYDSYYLVHGDTNYALCTVTSGEKSDSGLVRLDYVIDDDPRTVTLQETDEGYLFRSNLPRAKYATVEEALADMPEFLADKLVAYTPEHPSQFFRLEEGELFRGYCMTYFSLSSNLEKPFGWVASLYRLDRDQYNTVFYDPTSSKAKPQTFWECLAMDGEYFYVLYAPNSAPRMNRIEDLGQSAYEHTLAWLRETLLRCEGVKPADPVTNVNNTPLSDPEAVRIVNEALDRIQQDYHVFLDLTGEGHEPAGRAYGHFGIPYDSFVGTLRDYFVWVFPEDSGDMPHGDDVSPVDWVLTAGTDDGSVTFRFCPDSPIVTCTIDGEVTVLQALSRTGGPGNPSRLVRRWYDNVELSSFRAGITLDTSGPEWTEYGWFGSDYPRRVAEDLSRRYLEAYTMLPPGNQFHLNSVHLRSVEIYDMDDLDDPATICFHAEWVMDVDEDNLNHWNTGAGLTYIERGLYAGQWSTSGDGMVYLSGDGLWHVHAVGGGGYAADDDGILLPDIITCSDDKLLYFILNVADGAYAEGAQYELGRRFLARPADILNAMTWYNSVPLARWPDDERDSAEFLMNMLVLEFKVMRGPDDRAQFEDLLSRYDYDPEAFGGLARDLREAYENYAEP